MCFPPKDAKFQARGAISDSLLFVLIPVLLFSTRWKDNCRDYFDLVDVVASCSLCT